MGHSQRGLGLFGALIIVAVLAIVLYYAYMGVTGEEDAPGCRGTYTTCLQTCRHTRTEAPDLQRCQDACQRDVAECERRSQ